MTTAKAIAKVIPVAMSAGLLQHNLNYLRKKKKKKRGSLLRLGITNIVGAAMIQESADFIGEM